MRQISLKALKEIISDDDYETFCAETYGERRVHRIDVTASLTNADRDFEIWINELDGINIVETNPKTRTFQFSV